ncbi:hypothetical protein PCE1_000784 [Barthelona sp. PCE]
MTNLLSVIDSFKAVIVEEEEDGSMTGINVQTFLSAALTFRSLFSLTRVQSTGFISSDFHNYINLITSCYNKHAALTIQGLIRDEIGRGKGEDRKSATRSLLKLNRLLEYQLIFLFNSLAVPKTGKLKRAATNAYRAAIKPHIHGLMRLCWKTAIGNMCSKEHLIQRLMGDDAATEDSFIDAVHGLIDVVGPITSIFSRFLKELNVSIEEPDVYSNMVLRGDVLPTNMFQLPKTETEPTEAAGIASETIEK